MVVSVIFPILSSEFSWYNLFVYLGENIYIPLESLAENPRFLGVCIIGINNSEFQFFATVLLCYLFFNLNAFKIHTQY